MAQLLYELCSNPYLRAITWDQFTAKASAAGYPPSAALNRLIRRYLERGFDDGHPEAQSAADRHRRLGTDDKLPLSLQVLLLAPAAYGAYANEPLLYGVEGMPEDVGAVIVSHPSTIALATAERRTWRIQIHPSRDGLMSVRSDRYWLAGTGEARPHVVMDGDRSNRCWDSRLEPYPVAPRNSASSGPAIVSVR